MVTLPVRYLGPALASMGAMGVLLELKYTAADGDPEFDQNRSFFIESREAQEWRVRVKDRDQWAFSYQATILFEDGTERKSEIITSESDQLFLRTVG